MCHDHDSRPPAPPRTGDVGERGTLTLTSADGTEFSAAYAAPAGSADVGPADVGPADVGVVILPDVRGLHPYYVALAERFAEAGLPAVAIDYFGRTAGPAGGANGTGTREADFDWQQHLPKTTPEGIDADTTAAIGYLRERTRPDLKVVTVGFCFGGSHSWRQSGGSLDLAACAGFYGRPSVVGDAARRAHLPTLMLIAGADAATPVEDQLALADTMRAAGADVEAAVYEGAPHSFFDRSFGEWQEACADAWRRLLALTDRLGRREPAP
jgi:carboxymethylenebutenolidase